MPRRPGSSRNPFTAPALARVQRAVDKRTRRPDEKQAQPEGRAALIAMGFERRPSGVFFNGFPLGDRIASVIGPEASNPFRKRPLLVVKMTAGDLRKLDQSDTGKERDRIRKASVNGAKRAIEKRWAAEHGGTFSFPSFDFVGRTE